MRHEELIIKIKKEKDRMTTNFNIIIEELWLKAVENKILYSEEAKKLYEKINKINCDKAKELKVIKETLMIKDPYEVVVLLKLLKQKNIDVKKLYQEDKDIERMWRGRTKEIFKFIF